MRYKTVHVTWQDAVSESKWTSAKKVGGLAIIESCGWLVKDTEEYVTVCNSYSPEDDEVGDCISIPKAWIVDGRDTSDDVQPEPDAEAVHREQGEG